MRSRSDLPGALAPLPRTWWFPALKGVRESSEIRTYVAADLDALPAVDADESLSFLAAAPEHVEWSIERGDDGQQVRPLDAEGLREIAGTWPLPDALWRFAERRELQRRIRSATASYLDLGDAAVPTTSGGALVHVLTDQQSCRHWLLYVDTEGHAIVTTAEPVGFDRAHGSVPVDGSFDLQVCAYSFTEFLHRYWLETEIWFALATNTPVPAAAEPYLRQLRR